MDPALRFVFFGASGGYAEIKEPASAETIEVKKRLPVFRQKAVVTYRMPPVAAVKMPVVVSHSGVEPDLEFAQLNRFARWKDQWFRWLSVIVADHLGVPIYIAQGVESLL
ncbi:hypothetical protein [Sorangium cellulosum]|uniref:hypothetical protein n=1 Tax=Sorangium cellulosum TaxID=56 RepID=UPI00133153F5|nr:hypothetical protein [Sorangium cellulosum]